MRRFVDRFLAEPGTEWTWRGELVGGTTTFLATAYIVVVNPAILAFAGIPEGPSTVATALAAALGTLMMALIARRPFAVAPYMGENAFLAFGLAALGITWQQRLGAVFVAGALFLLLTFAGVRRWLSRGLSTSLKHAFAVAIGLFLAELGLYQTGIFTSFATGLPPAALAGASGLLRAPDVPVKLGDWSHPAAWLTLLGVALTLALVLRRVRGAILLGMLPMAAAGVALGLAPLPERWLAAPFRGELSLAPIAFQLDIAGILEPRHWPVLGTLALMGFLDTLGTLVALGAAAGTARRTRRPAADRAADGGRRARLDGQRAASAPRPRAPTSSRRPGCATARAPDWRRWSPRRCSAPRSSSRRSRARCRRCRSSTRRRWWWSAS